MLCIYFAIILKMKLNATERQIVATNYQKQKLEYTIQI